MTTKHIRTHGSRVTIDPEIVHEVLEKIAGSNGGAVTADLVLKEAKKRNSPLHSWFQWDDSLAAVQWRLEQARSIIRSVTVYREDPKGNLEPVRTRAFVMVEEDDERSYRPSALVMDDAAWSDQVMQRFKKEIADLEARYSEYVQFAAVLNELRKAQGRAEKRAARKKRRPKGKGGQGDSPGASA